MTNLVKIEQYKIEQRLMDFKKLLHKILDASQETFTPQPIIDAFNKQFDSPLNTEWHKIEESFEAVFYIEELEHIAKYQADGVLISLKINLPLETIPVEIYEAAKLHGEVMNAIKIYCREVLKYELIVRDQNLTRYSLLLDAQGEIIDKKTV